MAGALAARKTDKEVEKGRVETARVKRYWAGKAPAWAEEQEEEAGPREASRTAIAAPVIVKKADDPRLARLAQRPRDEDGVRERHREIRTAEVVRRRHAGDAADDAGPAAPSEDEGEGGGRGGASAQEEEEEEEDAEEIARRRQALRERCVAAARIAAHATA